MAAKSAFMPQQQKHRFEELRGNLELGKLTTDEENEYKSLLELVQNKSLQRLAWLVELSQITGEGLTDTMEKLGIKAVNPFNA